jgi:uncharacterized membrane protein (DUF4010 family)
LLLISVVVLPVMPDVGLGPYDVINPRQIWWMVVLISGLGFIGYLGVKFLGERGGIGLLALAGGLASSTAATLSLARLSKSSTGAASAFAGGTAAAWAVMFVRTAVIVTAIRPGLMPMLWLPLGIMFATTLLIAGITLGRQPEKTEATLSLPNPLDLKSAMVFAAVLTGALVLSRFAQEIWGQGGVFGVAVIAGAVDADAVTVSMGHLSAGELADAIAARAIIIATVANTMFKAALAMVAGTRAYGSQVLLSGALTISSGLLATLGALALGWL